MPLADVKKALLNFPELAEVGSLFLEAYPSLLETTHSALRHVSWAAADGEQQITLSLYIGDVRAIFPQLNLKTDAVFLDGFSPIKNPDMWGQDICDELARLSHTGTLIATWCVAAKVREHLTASGFEVQRVPGLPPKKNALTGVYHSQGD